MISGLSNRRPSFKCNLTTLVIESWLTNYMMYFPSQAQIKNLSNNNLKTLIFKIERKGLAHLPVADDALASAKLELELRKENAVTSN